MKTHSRQEIQVKNRVKIWGFEYSNFCCMYIMRLATSNKKCSLFLLDFIYCSSDQLLTFTMTTKKYMKKKYKLGVYFTCETKESLMICQKLISGKVEEALCRQL